MNFKKIEFQILIYQFYKYIIPDYTEDVKDKEQLDDACKRWMSSLQNIIFL